MNQAFWVGVVRLPLQILLVGGAVLAVVLGLQHWAGFPKLTELQLGNGDASGLSMVVAVLVFVVGLGTAGFLWWLSARFFRLVESKALDRDGLAAMKDLPMGLPEGTVRALLAMVVAVVGLPLLLFSKAVGLDEAIAGYINGIITGVFGFYFGTRTAGVPAQAVDKIAEANREALQQTKAAEAAKGQATEARMKAELSEQQRADAERRVEETSGQAELSAQFDSKLSSLKRHLQLAKTLATAYGPLLPKGVLPDNLATTIDMADKAVRAAEAVSGSAATGDQLTAIGNSLDELTGGQSPLGSMLKAAAPLMQSVMPAIPGLGPIAGLSVLLGVGVKLGSSQFQRWRARVLAAPLAQGLVEFGALSPELVGSALERAPLLRDRLAAVPNRAVVNGWLQDAVLRDDGPQRLLANFGPAGKVATSALTAEEAEQGIAELRQSLLRLYSSGDVQDAVLGQVKASMSSAVEPQLAASAVQSLTPADANRLIEAASGVSARPGVPQSQAAAFDALVMLADVARRDNIDLVRAMSEVK